MPFYNVQQLSRAYPMPGMTRRAVCLDNVMLTFFEFEAGTVLPMHGHPHEQITYVVAGELEFTLGDDTRVLHAGEGATVPAGVVHGAVARVAATVIDGWSPVREDYK